MSGGKRPIVSVIIPIYNGERYLRDAICSVLNQSFENFEILAIDDGSTDASMNILKEFTDSRLRLIKFHSNRGISAALNQGIVLSRGKYICRFDCDDVMAPKRLEHQTEYLERNPDISVLGSQLCYIDGHGLTIEVSSLPEKAQDVSVMVEMFGDPSIAHPAVLIRKNVFDRYGLYSENPAHFGLEDYELWFRLYSKGIKIENHRETLLCYRIHENQLTSDPVFKYKLRKRKNNIYYIYMFGLSNGIVAPKVYWLSIVLKNLISRPMSVWKAITVKFGRFYYRRKFNFYNGIRN